MENASRPLVEFYGVEILLLLSREISSARARLTVVQMALKSAAQPNKFYFHT
jgi:hypothetical protein